MSYQVHGEAIKDGDASGGVAIILYNSGSVVVRTLAPTEFLVITDVFISDETGGDTWLVADSKAAGRYIVHASFAAQSGVDKVLKSPYRCPRGVTPKFYGSNAATISICIIEGFITEA